MKKIMNEKLSISESNPLKARNYEYVHFTYPWHFHSQYEIVYVSESSGHCFAGDCIDVFTDNYLVLFGSNFPHYLRSDEQYLQNGIQKKVKGTVIQFEKDFMAHSINNYPHFIQVKKLLEDSHRGICFSPQSSIKIGEMIERIPSLDGFTQITDFLLVLHEMSIAEKHFMATPSFLDKLPKFGNTKIEKIIAFVNGNYTRNIDLNEISSLAAMNTSAFCRFFKENTGKTFVQYVTDMRIGHACKLLSLEKMNITQICLECGFESISHFNRTFKKITNRTPSQYQDSILT